MGHENDDVKIGIATIWAIGVGSALGGDFFGWQFVLYGGFASAFAAVLFAGLFYWLYAGAITELAARYRTSGGSYDFVRCALGRKTAAFMAVLNLLKLILANSALALAISSYLTQGGMPRNLQPLCWMLTYGLFTALDCVGVRQSANIQVLATVLCVAILLFYGASSLTKFSVASITDGGITHDGLLGFAKGLPFALQFFDGFEEVPLLMGYAMDPERTIPRAISACYVTVSFIAIVILLAGAGSAPASELLASDAPLMDGIDLVYGAYNIFSDIIAYLIVVGLLVNFFAFVLFASQQIQAIAEAGQFPGFLAYRHPVHGAPIAASITSSFVGFVLTSGFAYVFGEISAQDTLVTAALMPAVLGYLVLLQCVVKIRGLEASLPTKKPSARDMVRLGYEPGILRFAYGGWGARFAQFMCLLFAFSLIILAFVSMDFLYGLIVLALLGSVLYLAMLRTVGNDSNDLTPNIPQLISGESDEDFDLFEDGGTEKLVAKSIASHRQSGHKQHHQSKNHFHQLQQQQSRSSRETDSNRNFEANGNQQTNGRDVEDPSSNSSDPSFRRTEKPRKKEKSSKERDSNGLSPLHEQATI